MSKGYFEVTQCLFMTWKINVLHKVLSPKSALSLSLFPQFSIQRFYLSKTWLVSVISLDSLLSSCCPSREACCSRPRKRGRPSVMTRRRRLFCHRANKPLSVLPSSTSACWDTWRGTALRSCSNSLSLDCGEHCEEKHSTTLKTAHLNLKVWLLHNLLSLNHYMHCVH